MKKDRKPEVVQLLHSAEDYMNETKRTKLSDTADWWWVICPDGRIRQSPHGDKTSAKDHADRTSDPKWFAEHGCRLSRNPSIDNTVCPGGLHTIYQQAPWICAYCDIPTHQSPVRIWISESSDGDGGRVGMTEVHGAREWFYPSCCLNCLEKWSGTLMSDATEQQQASVTDDPQSIKCATTTAAMEVLLRTNAAKRVKS